MALIVRPPMTDDTGPGTDGTEVDKAFIDAICDEIDDQCHFAGAPGQRPQDTTSEVVTARGTMPSLDARLDVSLNDDGTLKPAASQASTAQLAAALAANWLYNDTFLLWPAGDTSAPVGWTVAGAGGTIARIGNGLADPNTKVGPFSVKITRAAADVTLLQNLMNATSFSASGQHFKNTSFVYGGWVHSSVPGSARIEFTDGVTTSVTDYHPGDGAWHWLSQVHTVAGTATSLAVQGVMRNNGGDARFSGMTAMPGLVAPTGWVACPTTYTSWLLNTPTGVVGVGTIKSIYQPHRPVLVKEVALRALTGPTGQALIVDVNAFDGAIWQSMFATRPQIAAGALTGSAKPDGTYRYRCLSAAVDYDVDQVGSGVAGSDLLVYLRVLQYNRPQEALLDPADQ